MHDTTRTDDRPPDEKVSILLVDDRPANLLALEAILGDLDATLVRARSGGEALARLREGEFAVVLLDVQMPELDGFETARRARGQEEARRTPIIFLTAHETDRATLEQAYSLGAVDYLVKPLVPVILRAKVAVFVELFEKTAQVARQAERLRRVERRDFDRQLAEGHSRQREQREWLNVTLASIGDAVITTDREGRVTFLNPVAESLTGWPGHEAEGQPLDAVFPIVHEETRAPVEHPVARVIRDGTVVGLGNHTVLLGRDGVERPIDDSAAPIRDEQGRTVGAVLIFRDVTEQRRAERAVRESEARKAAILETALDCIVTMDHRGLIVEFNPAAERTFGHRRADALGKPLGDLLVPPSLREAHRLGLARYLEAGEGPLLGQRVEVPAMRADGSEFPVELAITHIPLPGPPLFTAYLRDVSDRFRVERYRGTRLTVTSVLARAASAAEAVAGVLRAVGEGLDWDLGFFWGMDEGAGRLRCLDSWHRAGQGASAFEAASRQRTFVPGEGLPGRVWASAAPMWILDFAESQLPRVAAADREGLHGAFGCPVFSGADLLGVVEFFSRHIREADAGLLEMMATVAGQLGQFIVREQAEGRLQASERMLADFFENASLGLHWVGPDGVILRANRAELDLLGYAREEYVGRPIAEFHADQEAIADVLRRLQAGEHLRDHPARLRCKDGSIRHVLIDSSVLWQDGRFVHTRCFTRDVTEQKQAGDEVRFQAQLLDAVGQAAVVTDLSGAIIYWNRFAETLYGWTKAEALGRDALGLIVAPASRGLVEGVTERLRAGESWSGEFAALRRDGTSFDAFVTDTPVFDDRGRPRAIIGVSSDVSERKRVEHSLRFLADASDTLAALVDYESTMQKVAGLAVPHFADWCAVDMLGADGSPRRLAVTHVDPAKVRLAHELQRRYPPDPGASDGVWQVLRGGAAVRVEEITGAMLEAGARDGEHLRILRELGLLSYMCVPLRARGRTLGAISFVSAESGRRYTAGDLAFAEELARRAAVALENAQLYASLREADRLKDEFLAMLAHELRNPLAPIRNALHILKQPAADASVLGRVRDMAERQVGHMARLLDDLLDVSRISRGKIELHTERVDLPALLRRTVEAARPFMDERGHTLTVALGAGPMQVRGDPTRLEQVVTNLLNNAAKYTDPGGRVGLAAAREGDEVVLRVTDTGVGIAADMLPRVFELFVQVERRLDRSQGGIGIGLTLVRRLVELHGGSVQARSAGPGQGSEFIVRLPADAGAGGGAAEPAPGGGETAGGLPRRVMVVDDNQDAADSLALLLRLAGHEVRTAYDGPAALKAAQAFQPTLVFLDVGMPGMDGYEVARRLRGRPELRGAVLVALTGWGQQEDRRRSHEAGFDHHVVKPIEPDALQRILSAAR